MKKFSTILLLATAMLGIIVLMFDKGILRFNYPAIEEFPVRGIDISHHQGNIDWQELKEENISFVFIKATEGGDFKDPKFRENWRNAKTAGLTVSAYHFYRICKTGIEQADNFIAAVPNEEGTNPLAIDLEFGGNCRTDKSQDLILREIQNFMDRVEEHYGQPPIIYATKDFYDRFLQNQFMDCLIWIRDIYGRPVLSDHRKWTFWQFANRGHLKGIDGYVDLNVFNGSEKEFESLKTDKKGGVKSYMK